jgi:uncharacterized membrane-anchored protein
MIKDNKKKYIVSATTLIILLLINFSIWQKQTHITEGEVINIELAPVDPRSLMQGDYMTLRFDIARQIRASYYESSQTEKDDSDNQASQPLLPETAYVVVQLDENKVASFVSIEADNAESIPLGPQQRKLQYRVRQNKVKFATNGFFFAEGDEPIYRDARYGQFRVNNKGEVLLTGLLDKDFVLLGAEML